LAVPYRAFNRNLTASFLAPFIITLYVLAAVVLWRFQYQASITSWVEHSDQVILRVNDIELELREMLSGLHEYLVTSDKRYLTELGDARDAFGKNITKLASLVADNPSQEQRVLDINDLKGTWTEAIDSLLSQKAGSQPTKQALAEAEARGRAVFNSLEDFIAAEEQLRVQRATRQRTEYYVVFVLIPALTAIVMIFLSYWGWRQIQLATARFHAALDTAERARDAAEKASAAAEKANRAKDNFVGMVSHELRTPLNSIMLWSAALLRNPALGEDARRGMTAIERAVRAQAQLIEDLLDISRIESGRMRLDVQAVDLAEMVRAGVDSMRVAAEAKSITLQEIIDPRVDAVAGDPGRLQQVVWNLVSNAVKFTPNGGKIQVRVERINSHVEIIVADTGEGIEPAALESVFDRFWQADGTAQSKHGVGLGLSIVKEIVSLHGGTVVAHSEGPGKGCTFTVRLPLPISTIPSLESRRHPTVTQKANASAPRLDGLSILVVDDEPEAGDALKNLLGSLGARAAAATSVQAALATLKTLHFDAVISDIGMPVQDGYFLARELRKWEQETGRDGRMPLVALTAYGRVEDKVQILTAGFDSHAIQPVDPLELSTILETLITARRDMSGA
jgi:signal transduction histidine kinase/ActR/RegA family two-component response regulator